MHFAQTDQMEIICLELLYIFIHFFLVVCFVWFFVVDRNVYLDFKSTLFYNKNDNNDDDQIIRLRSVMYIVEYKERHLDWLAKQNPRFFLDCVY